MKSYLLLFIIAVIGTGLSAQSISWTPENPVSGSTVSIKYHAEDSELANHKTRAIIYTLEEGEYPTAHEVDLDNIHQGKFALPSEAKAMWVMISNEDGSESDNNDGLGYTSLIYKNDKVIKGSKSSLAAAYSVYPRYIGIDGNMDMASELIEEEYAQYPSQKNNFKCYKVEALVKNAANKESFIAELESKVQTLKGGSEEDLKNAMWLARVARNESLSNEIQEIASTTYPKGTIVMEKRFSAFSNIEGNEAKEKELLTIHKMLTKDEIKDGKLDGLARQLALSYGSEGNKEKFYEYANMITSANTYASLCNNLAWGFSGESLSGEGSHLEFGEEISKKSLELVEKEKIEKKDKPSYFTNTRWNRNMNGTYAMYADTYALLAYKLGDHSSALKYQTIAVEDNEYGDVEMNTRYAIFKEKVEGGESVFTFLEKSIAEGKASAEMKDQFKRIFIEEMDKSIAADKYVFLLEKEAKKKRQEEIRKKIIEKDEKPFTLVNLDGEEVTLDDMKGKVVVVDFWATWCGPCKMSFPGMQKAVDKYADNDKVEFLFVNTWENGKDKESKVREFIEKNEYTFHVLMDNDSKVVVDYGVNGIPTKYILDQNGKIRYESVGYDGNNDKLIDELSIVIDTLMESEQSVMP